MNFSFNENNYLVVYMKDGSRIPVSEEMLCKSNKTNNLSSVFVFYFAKYNSILPFISSNNQSLLSSKNRFNVWCLSALYSLNSAK